MAPAPLGDGSRCIQTQLEETGQPLHMPTMELDSPSTAASQTGEVGRHPDSPILAVGSMVPVHTGDVGLSTGPDSKI
ncbi:hypothetical protein BGZ97_010921, partial [Linnemannia gamsii]